MKMIQKHSSMKSSVRFYELEIKDLMEDFSVSCIPVLPRPFNIFSDTSLTLLLLQAPGSWPFSLCNHHNILIKIINNDQSSLMYCWQEWPVIILLSLWLNNWYSKQRNHSISATLLIRNLHPCCLHTRLPTIYQHSNQDSSFFLNLNITLCMMRLFCFAFLSPSFLCLFNTKTFMWVMNGKSSII